MATITTKHSMGDTVFYASITREQKRHDCPDCLGTKEWKAITPAGEELKLDCPRCVNDYVSNRNLVLTYLECVPKVRELTIGRIGLSDSKPQYMCNETGIGSGQLYCESDLFETQHEAFLVATAKAITEGERENVAQKALPMGDINKRLSLSDYQFKVAAVKSVKSDLYVVQWKLRDLYIEIADCNTYEDFKKLKKTTRTDK